MVTFSAIIPIVSTTVVQSGCPILKMRKSVVCYMAWFPRTVCAAFWVWWLSGVPSLSTPAKSGGLASQVARFRGANSPRGLCPPGSFWCCDKAQAVQGNMHLPLWVLGLKEGSRHTFKHVLHPYLMCQEEALRVISHFHFVWHGSFLEHTMNVA